MFFFLFFVVFFLFFFALYLSYAWLVGTIFSQLVFPQKTGLVEVLCLLLCQSCLLKLLYTSPRLRSQEAGKKLLKQSASSAGGLQASCRSSSKSSSCLTLCSQASCHSHSLRCFAEADFSKEVLVQDDHRKDQADKVCGLEALQALVPTKLFEAFCASHSL